MFLAQNFVAQHFLCSKLSLLNILLFKIFLVQNPPCCRDHGGRHRDGCCDHRNPWQWLRKRGSRPEANRYEVNRYISKSVVHQPANQSIRESAIACICQGYLPERPKNRLDSSDCGENSTEPNRSQRLELSFQKASRAARAQKPKKQRFFKSFFAPAAVRIKCPCTFCLAPQLR